MLKNGSPKGDVGGKDGGPIASNCSKNECGDEGGGGETTTNNTPPVDVKNNGPNSGQQKR